MDAPFLLPPPNPNLPQSPPRIFFVGLVICIFMHVAFFESGLLPMFTLSSIAGAVSMVIYGFGVFFPQYIYHALLQKVSQIAILVGVLWGYHAWDLSRHNGLIMVFHSTLIGALYGALASTNRLNIGTTVVLVVTLCFMVPSLLPNEFDRKYVFYGVLAAFAGFNYVRCFWEENMRRFNYGLLPTT